MNLVDQKKAEGRLEASLKQIHAQVKSHNIGIVWLSNPYLDLLAPISNPNSDFFGPYARSIFVVFSSNWVNPDILIFFFENKLNLHAKSYIKVYYLLISNIRI